MLQRRTIVLAVLFLLGLAPVSVAQTEPQPTRYRVEQVFRLETFSAEELAVPGRLRTEPVATAYVGRFRFILEQTQDAKALAGRRWKFTQVEIEPPTTEPPERADAGVERVLRMSLDWMQRLDGQEFSDPLSDLPALPLGESAPAWLTAWLRWAQTGGFSGTEGDPAGLAAALKASPSPVSYQLQWLRGESRQVPCHVQQARWTVPVGPAARRGSSHKLKSSRRSLSRPSAPTPGSSGCCAWGSTG